MNSNYANLLWYDRVELALDACRDAALRAGDKQRAHRALMLRLRANDRAEVLAEMQVSSPERPTVVPALLQGISFAA